MTQDFGWCTLKISNDNMYALLCLSWNGGEEEPIFSEQLVLDLLKSQHITNGINQIAIQSLLEHVTYGQYLCVAQGTPPTKGADGHYIFHKDLQDMKRKPLIHQDGTADYKNSLNLACIEQDEMLATYVPPEKGSVGLDVYGNIVPALGNGKEALPLHGKGIFHDDEKMHYYAQYSGHIVMTDTAINIEKLYRVNGDLDLEVGNIHFDGDVEICGDVRSGMTVDAKGDIFVHGHVGGCKLISKQNIIIDKGIQGHGNCEITAGTDIVCKFVENCKLYAGRNIYADSILNSCATAQNQVLVNTKNGIVIAGDIFGMAGIIVKSAGNEIGTSTLLRAGLPQEEYARVSELKLRLKQIDAKTDAFDQHLRAITDSETRTQIMRAKIVLASQKKEYSEELTALEERIANDNEGSFVRITGIVHSDVRIQLGPFHYLVHEDIMDVTYRIAGGQIVATGND